jgi:signal transduction histidine kinase
MSELSPGLPRINQFRASFDDAALEAAYLRSRLVPDRRRALQIVIVATIVASLNLVAEIPVGFTTDPMAEITILIRIVYFLIGLVAAVLVSAVTQHVWLERVAFAYGLCQCVLGATNLATHVDYSIIGPTSMMGVVVVIYLFAPLRFPVLLAVGILASILFWTSWSLLRDPLPAPQDAYRAALWLVAINLLGPLNANRMQREQRLVFAQHCQLEATLESERLALQQHLQFLALISHEVRNPLAIIKSQIQTALQELDGTSQAMRPRLDAMARASDRLVGLFERWIESDRLVSQAPDRRLHALNLTLWLSELSRPGSLSAPPWRLVSFDLCAEPLIVDGDEALLRVALENLVENARKFSPPSAPVTVTLRRLADGAALSVTDQGPGIAEADRDRIFHKYLRLRQDGGPSGLGLGLFIVRSVMDIHRGRVSLESAIGGGSTFTLWLPLAQGGLAAPIASADGTHALSHPDAVP